MLATNKKTPGTRVPPGSLRVHGWNQSQLLGASRICDIAALDAFRAALLTVALWIETICAVGRMSVTRVEPSANCSSHWREARKLHSTSGEPALFRYLRGGGFFMGARQRVTKLVIFGEMVST